MSTTYIVKQGEHLAGIAEQFGFLSFKAIWEHPQNAELKKLRKNPNILFPGDVVFIPDLEPKAVSVPSDKKHKFVLTVPTLMLQIAVHDVSDKPLKGALYVLSVRSKNRDGAANGDGMTSDPLEPDEQTANLWLPEPDLRLRLMIGYLNPLVENPTTEEEIAGWQVRLYNLGYFAGFNATNVKQLRWAVEEFQRDHGWDPEKRKKPTGLMDTETRDKLEKTYGC
jgi:N-acetylmuramoyl-L-alanine amidase